MDEKIKELSASTNSGYPVQVAITGFPGGGKTDLAKCYVYDNHSDKSSIVWTITADTPEMLWNEYYLLATELAKDERIIKSEDLIKVEKHKWETDETYKKRIFHGMNKALSRCPDWILIFDNVEKLSDVQQFLPNPGRQKGTIIFTTRNNNLLDRNQCLNISAGLDSDAATKLLEKITGLKSDNGTEELAKTLDYLPLYLVISAKAICSHNDFDPENKWTCGNYNIYIQKLATEAVEAEHALNIEQIEYNKTQHAVIRYAIDKLSKEAQELLKFCSYISPTEIPISLLKMFDMKYEALLREIQQRSLLQQVMGKSEYNIHRITQQIVRNYGVISAIIADKIIDAVLNKILNYMDNLDIVETRRIWEPLLPHILALADNTKFIEIANLDHSSRVLFYSGRLQHNLGRYPQAKDYLERALAIGEKHYGVNNIGVAQFLNALGKTYLGLGKSYTRKAKECYEQSLEVIKEHSGENNIEVAEPLNGLGYVWTDCGNYSAAKDCHERALSIIEKHYGINNIGAAQSLHGLGTAWSHLGDSNKAVECSDRASAIMMRITESSKLTASYIPHKIL